MNDNSRFHRFWRALADSCSFQVGTIEGWFDRTPETPQDRTIREEGQRIRRAFPGIDFDHPGARKSGTVPRSNCPNYEVPGSESNS